MQTISSILGVVIPFGLKEDQLCLGVRVLKGDCTLGSEILRFCSGTRRLVAEVFKAPFTPPLSLLAGQQTPLPTTISPSAPKSATLGCQLEHARSPENSLNKLPRMGVPGNRDNLLTRQALKCRAPSERE
ncbi:hypothetical protein Taro_049092 [Colocasia esculenta]|uniref:Uncharacterized protein n=1 Tax=Colocasia esculenta TaxID=4460 RepID=A0A843XA34_COLES|nr:hypothetical protein [Colocasia esculenta]